MWVRRWLIAALAVLAVSSSFVELEAGPPRKGAIDGFVEDHKQKPLAGAKVFVLLDGEVVVTGTSDEQGRYSLEAVPVGRVVLQLCARGFVRLSRETVVAGKGRTRALDTMEPGVTYAGQVKDASGVALPGAWVGVARVNFDEGVSVPAEAKRGSESGPDSARHVWATTAAATQTDAEGKFELEGVAPTGKYLLRVAHPRHAPGEVRDLPVKAALVKDDLLVTLEPGTWIIGRVLDEKGKPVKGAIVRCEGLYSSWTTTGLGLSRLFDDEPELVEPEAAKSRPTDAVTDAEGRFEVGGYRDPTGELLVDAPGFLYKTHALADMAPGQAVEGVDIQLVKSPGSVDGIVVDSRGKPIERAHLRWWGITASASARTAKNGRFKLPRMKSDQPMDLDISAGEFWDAEVPGVAAGARSLRITMDRAPVWRAVVKDEQGAAVAGVSLNARALEKDADPAAPWTDSSLSGTWYSAPEGGAHQLQLPRGQVQVQVTASGYQPLVLGPYATQAGKDVDAGALVLKK